MKKICQLLSQIDELSSPLIVQGVKGRYVKEKMMIEQGHCLYASCDFGQYQNTFNQMDKTQYYENGDDAFFIEKVGSRQTLVICGAGHVSMAIIQMARLLDFYIIVLEDREEFAMQAKQAGADKVIVASFQEAMAQIKGSLDTYFIIVTRGHGFDKVCLKAALHKPRAYIGMMGSKHRVSMIMNQLIDEGEDEADVRRIFTPIGLKIEAQTPQEIAVSILAEIILNKNKHRYTTVYDQKLIEAINTNNQKAVLATIIKKHGSTPRDIGVMMLVKEDGTCVGTIGGGLAENQIKEAALALMHSDNDHSLMSVNMCSHGPSLEGMVCGGTIDVYLEVL